MSVTIRKITIPKEMHTELHTRLEECGAYNPADDRHGLYMKVDRSKTFSVTQDELDELMWHALTMIEIAEIDYLGEDPTLNREARGAKKFILSLE